MRLKQFMYLQTIAEVKSITKASQKLFVSHQAISYALQNLEKDYQTTLFKRTSHGVALTADGEYVLNIAEQILQLNDQVEKHFLEKDSARLTGNLKVSAVSTFISCILPQAYIQFVRKCPNVSFELQRANVDTIVSALCKGETDLGFLSITRIRGKAYTALPAELIFTPLSHFKYCALVGHNSPLANYKTLSVKSLLSYPVVFLEEQVNDDLENYIPYCIISCYGKPEIMIANSSELYSKLISENMGISFSTTEPSFNNMLNNTQLVAKPLRDNIDGHIGYLHRRDNTDNPIIHSFLDVVHDCYASNNHLPQ